MPTEYKGFPSLLYYHLIASGKHEVAAVADKMGIAASTLYKHAEGETNFPPDLMPRLYNATHERDFLDFCVKGTDQIVVPRPPAAANGRSLELETLDVPAVVGRLALGIVQSLEDGKLTELEQKKIERDINCAMKELEEVRQKVLQAAHDRLNRPTK